MGSNTPAAIKVSSHLYQQSRDSAANLRKLVSELKIMPEQGVIKDSQDRTLSTYTWAPKENPRALVFLCHGYAEHLTPYYDSLAEEGERRNFLIFGHDHVGHGNSEGERVQVGDMSEYVKPVMTHCADMKKKYPDLPLFIIGHSMGGLITLLILLNSQEDSNMVKGAVLMGPLIALDPSMASPFKKFLAKTASKILPSFALGGIDSNLVTSDQDWRDKRSNDDKMHHGGYKALHSHVLLSCLSELGEVLPNVKTPYLLLHGEEDKICSVEGSKEFHKVSSSQDKTLNIVQGGRHHLFIEQKETRDKAVTTTWDWIEQRI